MKRLVGAVAAVLVMAAPAHAAVTLDGPSGPTNDATPTFTWDAAGATCAVDGGLPAPCASPLTLSELPNGPHSLEVEAGGERASRTFTVDTAKPFVTIGDATLDDAIATVGFATEDGADTTCAVDDAPPVPCTSPFVTADLANGGHFVRVAATDAAGNTGEGVQFVQVALDAPDTGIAAGPEGETEDAQPPFTFTSTRPRSTFRCQVDDGAFADCLPSWQPPSLAPGKHTLRVLATDAGGRADSTPAERAFTVVTCSKSATIGVVQLAADCFRSQDGKLVTTGSVKVNGITFNPRGGQRVIVDTAARKVILGDVQLRMGSIVLYQGDLDFNIPEGDSFVLARIDLATFSIKDKPPADSEAAVDLQGADGSAVAGFPLKGEATLTLTKGTSVLEANMELPKVFTDAEGKGLTGHVKIVADNAQGVRLDEAKATAPLAFIGKLELHDLFVSFVDKGTGPVSSTCNTETPGLRWEGGASAIVVPVPGGLRLEDVGVGFADGELSHADATWKPTTEGGADLGGGVKVQKLSVSLCAGPPLTLGGRVALTALPGADGKPRLEIPDAGIKFTAGDPWTIKADAPAATLDLGTPIAFKDLGLAVSSNGAVDFSAGAKFAIGVKGDVGVGMLDAAVTVDASVKGFIERSKFNADLKATGCFAGTLTIGAALPFDGICAGVDGVVSSTGMAVCGSLKVKDTDLGRIGAGLKWGGPLEFMTKSCDVGKWRVEKTAAASAVGEHGVTVPGGKRGVLVAVRGSKQAPRVTLSGPGVEIATGDPRTATKTDDGVAFSNVATKTTYIALRKPRGGRWTVKSDDAVASVSAAPMLPPAKMTASVKGGKLSYRTDQRVTLIERGRNTNRTLRTVTGRGSFAFAPADGPGGTRRIEAVTYNEGLPRERRTLATLKAPGRARPATPRKVKLTRGATSLQLAWTGSARRYGIRVSVSDGRDLFYLSRGRTLRVPGIDRGRSVRVRVVGLRADNTHGRAALAQSIARRSR